MVSLQPEKCRPGGAWGLPAHPLQEWVLPLSSGPALQAPGLPPSLRPQGMKAEAFLAPRDVAAGGVA